MDYKRFATSVELKNSAGEFSATFSRFNVVDKDGDVTLPAAIEDGTEVVIGAFGHGSVRGGGADSLPTGKGVIRNDGERAYVEGTFFTDTGPGLDTYRTVRNLAALGEWSYGYLVDQASTDPSELRAYPGARRVLKGVVVFEVSPVLVGAGVDTTTDDVKGTVDSELNAIRSRLEHDRIADQIATLDVFIEYESIRDRLRGVA